VFITWNFLWDVPGEKDEWYGEMAGWLRLVSHLQPPGVDRIQFHRFSPYHQRPESFGLSLVPFPLYSYVYPLAPEDMRDLAYYFNDTERKSAKLELERRPHLKQVMRIIAVWSSLWGQDGTDAEVEPPTLTMRETSDGLHITDTRPCAHSATHHLQGLPQHIYKACDEIQTVNSLVNTLSTEQQTVLTADTVQRVLDELVERRLLLHLDGRYLALALREVRRIPDSLAEFPGGYTDIQAWQARYAN
jgi:magnesium-protoporphyrin IX monomethyl ester (oxidative) cyclase